MQNHSKTLHFTNAYHSASGGVATSFHALLAEANKAGRPMRLVVLAVGELVERLARELAEGIGVEVVQGGADDPAAGNVSGPGQMEQPRQELASRQVARGTHEDDDLGIFRTNARGNFFQGYSTFVLRRALPRPERLGLFMK